MSGRISVVICCYNSAARLPETLRHLAAQKGTEGIPWEVLVVDNASKDSTAETARHYWKGVTVAPLRVVGEVEAGLSHARIRGIREARYEIISFIDDDNWAAADWIARVAAIFAGHPEIGAAGGRIEAVCETPPPDWFALMQGHYAVGRQHDHDGDITDTTGTLLCGAGLNVRTATVRKLLEDGFVFLMSDRKGNSLSTGGDTELCFALRGAGCRFWYDDNLFLQHFIPKGRLAWDYIVRLKRGIGESSTLFAIYLCALNAPPYESYPEWKKSWFFQTLKAYGQLAQQLFLHPGVLVQSKENWVPVLEYEELKSKAASMWRLLGRYRKTIVGIRQMPWVRNQA